MGAVALAGCSLWQGQQVVQLPELPAAWRHLDVTLKLTVVDGRNGREQRLPDARPGARLTLPVGRYTATLILAQAYAGWAPDTLAMRPAGAVIPLSGTESGALQVTWERGLLASLVLDLWRGGTNPWRLNLGRLDREISARAAGDPWSLDRTAILAALEADTMRVTVIRPLPEHSVSLQLPAGRWVWWDPFAAPLISDGSAPLPVVARTGYHLLLGDTGAAVALQVDAAGGVVTSPVAAGLP